MSSDETRSLIEQFRDVHEDCFLLLVDDPVRGHYQGAKMAIYAETFRRHATLADIDLDWLFFVDADEFISSDTHRDADAQVADFERVLADPLISLLVFHWIQMCSPDVIEQFHSNNDPFERIGIAWGRLLPVVSKVAFRVGHDFRIDEGNHFVQTFDAPFSAFTPVATFDWYIYHFMLRSLDHVREKVVNGGKAFLHTRGLEKYGGHWKERYHRYQQYGDSIVSDILISNIQSIKDSVSAIIPKIPLAVA